jgi:acyl-CoA thioesterase-2
MTASLNALLELLDLEQIEENIFRGTSHDIGSGRVFGGQVLAQALVAAGRTLEGRSAHSLHGYFMLPGDLEVPIVYLVDRIRDGRSFTTRRVVAIQHGEAIFNMAASFHTPEDGIEHQDKMPAVPEPESLPREVDLIRAMEDRIPPARREVYTRDRPVEMRPADPVDPLSPEQREPFKSIWLRAAGALGDDPLLHQSLLAYASDHSLLSTALLPHGISLFQPNLQAATLDHALWFHRPFRADEWLLYSTDSPSASGARGFTRGTIFTREGSLVASVAQEGLLRLKDGREPQ